MRKILLIAIFLFNLLCPKSFLAQYINYQTLEQTTVDYIYNASVPIKQQGINDYYYDHKKNKLYIVGGFETLGSPPLSPARKFKNIARFDLNTGLPDSTWNPIINNGEVRAITKYGDKIYLGGSFTTVNGAPANKLVVISEATGLTVQTFTYNFSQDTVNCLTLNGNGTKLAVGFYGNRFPNGTTSHAVCGYVDLSGVGSYSMLVGSLFSDIKVEKIAYYNNNFFYLVNEYSGPVSNFDGGPWTSSYIYEYEIGTQLLTTIMASKWKAGPPNSASYCQRNPSLDFFQRADSLFVFSPDSIFPLKKFNGSAGTTFNKPAGIINRQTVGLKLTSSIPILFNYPLTNPSGYPNITNSYATIYSIANPGCSAGMVYIPYSNATAIGCDNDRYIFSGPPSDPSTACTVNYPSNYAFNYNGSVDNNNILGVNNPIGDRMRSQGDRFFSIKSYAFGYYGFWTGGPTSFNKRANGGNNEKIAMYCLRGGKLPPIKQVNNLTSICRGQNYKFCVTQPSRAATYNWSFTGPGATITNGTKDTATFNFAFGVTTGSIMLTGFTNCGEPTDTVYMTINYWPLPSITSSNTQALNCFNNKQAVLTASSNPPSYFYWYGPTTGTVGSLGSTLTTTVPGVYTASVTEQTHGCTNAKTTNVLYDTLKPSITNVVPVYTLNCSPPTLTITPSTCASPPCHDSLYWAIGNAYHPMPIVVNTSLILVIFNQSLLNGCINSYTTSVISNNSGPTYTMNSSVTTQTVGLPQFIPITCYNDSVLLFATAASSTKIKWKRPIGDSVINPYYAKTAGIYQLLVHDTITGCSNVSFFGQILSDKIPPNLNLANNSAVINCSYNTATLQASTSTPSTNLQWTCPVISYTNSNPATATQSGLYYAIATNTTNGCSLKDSMSVLLLSTLSLNTTNDSTICNGSSVTLTVSPIGGTPPFSYAWSNSGGSLNTATFANNISTINYIVTLTDNANCIGTDTIKISVPLALTDSTASFKSCDPQNPAGQIQVFGKGGTPPYKYSINNGISFQTSNAFSNLGLGNYQFIIKDALGCLHTLTCGISLASQMPKVDFIVNTTMMQADTFVIVDISNPRPDSIHWQMPSNIHIVNNSNSFSPVIVSPDTGSFYVKAIAHFGNCIDSLNKLVHFIKYDTTASGNVANRGIKTFSLYPNPNTGQFNVVLEFYKKQNFVIKINTSTGAEVYQAPAQYGNNATVPINMPINTPGNYFIKVIAEFDAKQKGFIITN